MFWMRAYLLLEQVGGGWALEILSLLGPKWYLPIGLMPFQRAQKNLLKYLYGYKKLFSAEPSLKLKT